MSEKQEKFHWYSVNYNAVKIQGFLVFNKKKGEFIKESESRYKLNNPIRIDEPVSAIIKLKAKVMPLSLESQIRQAYVDNDNKNNDKVISDVLNDWIERGEKSEFDFNQIPYSSIITLSGAIFNYRGYMSEEFMNAEDSFKFVNSEDPEALYFKFKEDKKSKKNVK